MPRPDKNEKRGLFVPRAIKEFKSEGFSQKQAVGRAEGFYDAYAGGAKKKDSIYKK